MLTTLVALALVAAEPADPQAVTPPLAAPPVNLAMKRETAVAGVVLSVLAAGLAAAIPATDAPVSGTSPGPIILGTTAFFVIAFMRPIVFFSVVEKPTPVRNVLRVAGSLTAVAGLVSFIAGFALYSGNPQASSWAMVGAAGLEALSLGSFSTDAMLAASKDP